MPKKLVTPAIQRDYKQTIQRLILDLSQPLTIIQESPLFVDCPNCLWDSINKKSSNVFNAGFISSITIFTGTDQERTISPVSFTAGRCPVCIGEGQLFTNTEICIPALINYFALRSKDGSYRDLPAGKEGTNHIQVKTLECYYNLLRDNHDFVVYDGIKCQKFIPPFVRGLGGDNAVCEMWLETEESGEGTLGTDPNRAARTDDPRRKIKGPTDLRVLRGQIKGR